MPKPRDYSRQEAAEYNRIVRKYGRLLRILDSIPHGEDLAAMLADQLEERRERTEGGTRQA